MKLWVYSVLFHRVFLLRTWVSFSCLHVYFSVKDHFRLLDRLNMFLLTHRPQHLMRKVRNLHATATIFHYPDFVLLLLADRVQPILSDIFIGSLSLTRTQVPIRFHNTMSPTKLTSLDDKKPVSYIHISRVIIRLRDTTLDIPLESQMWLALSLFLLFSFLS